MDHSVSSQKDSTGEYVEFAGRRFTIVHWSGLGILFNSAGRDFDFFDNFQAVVHVRNNASKPPFVSFAADLVITAMREGVVAAKYRCLRDGDRKVVKAYFDRLTEARRDHLPWR